MDNRPGTTLSTGIDARPLPKEWCTMCSTRSMLMACAISISTAIACSSSGPSEGEGRRALEDWVANNAWPAGEGRKVTSFTKNNGIPEGGGEGYCMEYSAVTGVPNQAPQSEDGAITFIKTERGWRADHVSRPPFGSGKC